MTRFNIALLKWFLNCAFYLDIFKVRNTVMENFDLIYPTKKNAPLRTVQLSGKPQVIGKFSLYQCKGMSLTAALRVFCNQASKLC